MPQATINGMLAAAGYNFRRRRHVWIRLLPAWINK
jgi:hypothetical protein